MKEQELLELQIKFEEGFIGEEALDEKTKEELKNLYKKQIEEKKENLKRYKDEIQKYLKN